MDSSCSTDTCRHSWGWGDLLTEVLGRARVFPGLLAELGDRLRLILELVLQLCQVCRNLVRMPSVHDLMLRVIGDLPARFLH